MGSACSTSRSEKVAPAPSSGASDSGKLVGAAERPPARPKLPPIDVRSNTIKLQPLTPVTAISPQKGVIEAELALPSHLATVGKGVSLRGLRKVRNAIRKHFGEERYAQVSTTEVCHQWVQAVTAPAGKCRLVELPGLLDRSDGDVGVPMYFISHAWSNSIELLFRKVFDFLASADDGTRVWLDVLAVCQHGKMPAHRNDIAAFADVVAACSGGTLVVMDLTRCNPSSRAWCVFEWAHTLAAHGPDGLHMSLAPLERAAVFADLDVERAECFRPADKEMIMREVRRQHGSPEAFNAKLKLQLLLEPLSYTVDLRRLQERSRDTLWDFGHVDRWLEEGCAGARGSRALCVVSGAGEGKSTISSELVRRLSPASTISTASLSGQVICAYHFLKYNDQRRLEPVRIIKTMAFQLASRLPAVCSELLDCDVAEVAQLTDVNRAFELLLLRPLQGRSDPVVVVLDALDEADPAPFVAAPDPSMPSSPSAAARSATVPSYPVLCGNRALQLLTKHLQRLPSAVRFFVTTRPDAASGQVVPALERTFHGQGGSSYIKPSQLLRTIAQKAAADGGGGGGDGGGVMVYHTVVRACLRDSKEEETGSAPATPSAAAAANGGADLTSPLPPLEGGKSRRGGPLLLLLSGLAGPTKTALVTPTGGNTADLTGLYRVYGKVFLRAYETYDARKRADVSKLLNVLMAAQEPLSQSLVQQLGLGQAVPLLPGFPVLFYVDEHHLFTLHKSLADWLLLDAGGPGLDRPTSRQDSGRSAAGGGAPAGNRSIFARLHGPSRPASNTRTSATRASGAAGFFQSRAHGHASRAAIESEAAAEAGLLAAAAAAANAPSASFDINIAQGHLLLGRYLSSTRNSSPSHYCLKYLVTHLAAGGMAAADLLDDVLASFGFLEAVFASGFGANVIRALGSMAHATRLSRDALRWLRAKQHDIVAAAASTSSGTGPAAAVLGSAMMSPIGSELYRVAVRAAGQGWRTRVASPSYEEWPADQAVLKGHAGNVTCVLFSPDGRQLVSSSGGGHELRVWDISSGTCTAVLQGHTADVTCLAISSNGQLLASGSNDMTCRLWDAATGLCTAVLQGHAGGITGVAFSPPERGRPLRLVSGSSDNTLRIWSAVPKSPRPVKPSHGSTASNMRPPSRLSGERYGSTTGVELGIRSSDIIGPTPSELRGVGPEECSHACVSVMHGKDGGLQGLAWCPSGKRLAGAHGADVCLWSVPSGKVTVTLSGHTANVLAVSFSPTEAGRRLASCGWDKVVRLWDTRTNKCMATLSGHSELIRGLVWSPDAKRLATASSDNTIRMWDATPTLAGGGAGAGLITVSCTALLRQAEWMTAVSFSPDGRTLASGSVAKELRIWDVAACEAEHAASIPVPSAGSRLKSNLLGTLDKMTQKSLKLFSADGAAPDPVPASSTCGGHTADVTCVALSPDGTMLATSAQDRTVRLYDSASARWLATLSGHSACVTCVAWAPRAFESTQLASVSHDLTVRVWDLDLGDGVRPVKAKCTATMSGHTDRVRSVAWSPAANGQLATGAEDNHVRLWDSNSGASLATMWGHGNYVTCVSYCPADSGRTVTSASQDNTIRIWDTTQFKCIRILQGHEHYVNHIVYTPCGARLASASCDQTARIWEHNSGKCVTILHGHNHFVNCVAFEPSRGSGGGAGGGLPRRLASASTDETVRVWDLKTRKCVSSLSGHSGPVFCVTWMNAAPREGGGKSPPELVSGAADHSIRVWCEGYEFEE